MSALPGNTVEAARVLLKERDLLDVISPAKLVASSKEMQLGLSETLSFLAKLLDGGQGQGPFPETKEVLENTR